MPADDLVSFQLGTAGGETRVGANPMQHSRPERVQRESDCAFESICETCSYFHTSIEFRPPSPPRIRRNLYWAA